MSVLSGRPARTGTDLDDDDIRWLLRSTNYIDHVTLPDKKQLEEELNGHSVRLDAELENKGKAKAKQFNFLLNNPVKFRQKHTELREANGNRKFCLPFKKYQLFMKQLFGVDLPHDYNTRRPIIVYPVCETFPPPERMAIESNSDTEIINASNASNREIMLKLMPDILAAKPFMKTILEVYMKGVASEADINEHCTECFVMILIDKYARLSKPAVGRKQGSVNKLDLTIRAEFENKKVSHDHEVQESNRLNKEMADTICSHAKTLLDRLHYVLWPKGDGVVLLSSEIDSDACEKIALEVIEEMKQLEEVDWDDECRHLLRQFETNKFQLLSMCVSFPWSKTILRSPGGVSSRHRTRDSNNDAILQDTSNKRGRNGGGRPTSEAIKSGRFVPKNVALQLRSRIKSLRTTAIQLCTAKDIAMNEMVTLLKEYNDDGNGNVEDIVTDNSEGKVSELDIDFDPGLQAELEQEQNEQELLREFEKKEIVEDINHTITLLRSKFIELGKRTVPRNQEEYPSMMLVSCFDPLMNVVCTSSVLTRDGVDDSSQFSKHSKLLVDALSMSIKPSDEDRSKKDVKLMKKVKLNHDNMIKGERYSMNDSTSSMSER